MYDGLIGFELIRRLDFMPIRKDFCICLNSKRFQLRLSLKISDRFCDNPFFT